MCVVAHCVSNIGAHVVVVIFLFASFFFVLSSLTDRFDSVSSSLRDFSALGLHFKHSTHNVAGTILTNTCARDLSHTIPEIY